jgi:hypothetical protein
LTGIEPYDLVVTPTAARAIRTDLPEAVATAAIEFITALGSRTRTGWASGCVPSWPASTR